MTEFHQHEQLQTSEVTDPSPRLTRSTMPSFYPSTRHRTLITKHLAEQDEEDDPNPIYKDAFIIQIFQHWRIKTLEHHQGLNNATNLSSTNHFSQALAIKSPPVETTNTETKPPEISFDTNEPDKSIPTVQKRVKPVPASYLRRKEALKISSSLLTESANPNLLAPCTSIKSRPVSTAARKANKPPPIFIAPKKTQPSPVPRSYAQLSFEESAQMKRKTTLDKQNSITDDQSSVPISPTWVPAPPTMSTRFHIHPPGSSIDDDDETSSDDGSFESLLIRNKNRLKKPIKIEKIYPLPPNIMIPTAILITDPHGHPHLYDSNSESLEKSTDNPQTIGNRSEMSSPNNSETYVLHSIGEEDEPIDKNPKNGIILSKELDRIEAYKRSRQKNPNAPNKNMNNKHNENRKNRLGRRWSDGSVSDDEDEHNQSPMVKMASVTSILKQSANSAPKISKTKQFLIKLHLASPNKDDSSNALTTNLIPPPPQKHSRAELRTPQSSLDESQQSSSKINRLDSTNTVDSMITADSQPTQRQVSVTNSEKKLRFFEPHESVLESAENIDRKFGRSKLSPHKRASSSTSVQGSQLSLNSVKSEAKARYELEITGTIQLKLSYNVNIGALDVLIQKCTNLAQAKRNQTMNPYCKIYLLPDKSKGSKRKTTMKKDTSDPVFNETLRYHLSLKEFDLRTLWISVWHEASLSHNDFLGEINISLANCRLDISQEYTLQHRAQQETLSPTSEPREGASELSFELTFIEHPKNQAIGTIQVNSIQGRGIYHGKHHTDVVCKGLLMPQKIKRKLPTVGKEPSPKWDIPLRWENIRLDNLKNTSIEISVWNQEVFRKTMIGYVRLNSIERRRGEKLVKALEVTPAERSAWESFKESPTEIHEFCLPLRPGTNQQK